MDVLGFLISDVSQVHLHFWGLASYTLTQIKSRTDFCPRSTGPRITRLNPQPPGSFLCCLCYSLDGSSCEWSVHTPKHVSALQSDKPVKPLLPTPQKRPRTPKPKSCSKALPRRSCGDPLRQYFFCAPIIFKVKLLILNLNDLLSQNARNSLLCASVPSWEVVAEAKQTRDELKTNQMLHLSFDYRCRTLTQIDVTLHIQRGRPEITAGLVYAACSLISSRRTAYWKLRIL